MTDDDTTTDKSTRDAPDFAAFLAQTGKGRTNRELGEVMAELVRTVLETGKLGTLAYSLKVKRLDDGTVSIEDEIKTKMPQFDRPASIWYATSDGALSRNDPRQDAFPGMTND